MSEVKKSQKATEVRWFVVKVKWRHEDDLAKLFREKGKETYIAKRFELVNDRKGGKVRKEVCVIPEVVFVRCSYEFLDPFIKDAAARHKLTIYYATVIEDGHRTIMKVPDAEMANFMRIATKDHEDVVFFKPEELQLIEGDKVRVHGGPFDGAEGTLLKVKGKKGKRVVVSIEGLFSVASASIEPEYIEVISTKKRAKMPAVEDVDALMRSVEEYMAMARSVEGEEGREEGRQEEGDDSDLQPKRRAMDVMADRVLRSMPRNSASLYSANLALLGYAIASRNEDMKAKQAEVCRQIVGTLAKSGMREKMEEMLGRV